MPGGVSVDAGPSFEDHIAMIKERQKLEGKCDTCQVALRTLEGLVTWFNVRLPDAESNPQLSIIFQEAEKEISPLSRYTNEPYIVAEVPHT